MAENRAISGARAKLYANGTKPIGWATGVSATETTQLVRVDVLGNIDSEDIEPTGRTVSLQCDLVRIIGKSLGEIGIVPRGGTNEVLTFPMLSMDLYDPITDQFLCRILGARCESQSWRLDRSGVMTQNLSMQARRMVDEKGV